MTHWPQLHPRVTEADADFAKILDFILTGKGKPLECLKQENDAICFTLEITVVAVWRVSCTGFRNRETT